MTNPLGPVGHPDAGLGHRVGAQPEDGGHGQARPAARVGSVPRGPERASTTRPQKAAATPGSDQAAVYGPASRTRSAATGSASRTARSMAGASRRFGPPAPNPARQIIRTYRRRA